MDASLASRQNRLISDFHDLSWEDRYKKIIQRGKGLEPYPEAFRNEDYKVKGCQSQVWLHAELTPDGRIHFRGDSDAMIVKGLVALLLDVYSNALPAEILQLQPDFLKQIGLESHLSPSRANGLYAMLKQILFYATAFQAQASRRS